MREIYYEKIWLNLERNILWKNIIDWPWAVHGRWNHYLCKFNPDKQRAVVAQWVFPIFVHILFFARSCSNFVRVKNAATVLFWTLFVLFWSPRSSLFTSPHPLLSTWVTCPFSTRAFQWLPVVSKTTSAAIGAWFVDRYFDQQVRGMNPTTVLILFIAISLNFILF